MTKVLKLEDRKRTPSPRREWTVRQWKDMVAAYRAAKKGAICNG
jgi:hypothetical protein